ncbi:hypothetical protein [Amphritea sp.]|uniref:hypothetical protein n=1 Tax=Amphritea sp. TaxID=1872502 RepID=UPI0025BCFAC6|nr:hypothetical protein [Amphritea sp.]
MSRKNRLSALVMVLLFTLPLSASIQAEYSLIQGEKWSGIQIGTSAPRSLDLICNDSNCLQILNQFQIPAELQSLGIRKLSLETLADIKGVRSEKDRLFLPDKMGRAIYRENDRFFKDRFER